VANPASKSRSAIVTSHLNDRSSVVDQRRRGAAAALVRRSQRDAPIRSPAETNRGHGGTPDAAAPVAQMDEPPVGVGFERVTLG
jgi:hypothetical protein